MIISIINNTLARRIIAYHVSLNKLGMTRHMIQFQTPSHYITSTRSFFSFLSLFLSLRTLDENGCSNEI